MIFAAGLGTRFKPWTDNHPKALAIINGKSLLQRNIEYLQQYGIFRVVVNAHHFAAELISTIEANKGWGSEVIISDETDAVLETGGGLKKAAPLLESETIVIINADILTDLPLDLMLEYHKQQQCLATLAVTGRTTTRYFLFDKEDILCGWRNVKSREERLSRSVITPVEKAFSGVHVIHQSLIELIKQQGKFSMVDVYLDLARDHIIKCFDHSNSKFIDVGKPESVAIAEQLFK